MKKKKNAFIYSTLGRFAWYNSMYSAKRRITTSVKNEFKGNQEIKKYTTFHWNSIGLLFLLPYSFRPCDSQPIADDVGGWLVGLAWTTQATSLTLIDQSGRGSTFRSIPIADQEVCCLSQES